MKKYTLEEQLSRIKGVMKSIINENIDEESDLAEGNWNSPEERERIRMYNETANGVTMVLQSIDKLFDSINREAYHKSRKAIENVLRELHNEVNNPQESSVENDDYDERQERNYGIEDN